MKNAEIFIADLCGAKKIQESMIPKKPYRMKNFEMDGMMKAARQIGGDFFNYFQIDKSHFCFFIGDVSGKGISAALYMVSVRTLILNSSNNNLLSPSLCLAHINKIMHDENDESMFVTLFYGVVNVETGILTYTNAGHERPILFNKIGNHVELEGGAGVVLGVREENKYTEDTVKLNSGDMLFVYTDGLTDAINDKEEEYGIERVIQQLKKHNKLRPSELIFEIFKGVDDFKENQDQFDDLVLFSLRCHEQ